MTGYRPGLLLAKLRHDLRHFESERVTDTCCRFRAPEPAIEFFAEEHVEPQFLMHVVTTRFSIRIPGGAPGQRRLKIRHRGTWKRSGIDCVIKDGVHHELANRLTTDAELTSALLPLDFTECELHQNEEGWTVSIVHFGASEVVYRFPPLRQYVRLPAAQLPSLLHAFAALRRILEHDARVLLTTSSNREQEHRA